MKKTFLVLSITALTLLMVPALRGCRLPAVTGAKPHFNVAVQAQPSAKPMTTAIVKPVAVTGS